MNEITSTANKLVKETVKLHQKKYRQDNILLEGKKAFLEALEHNLKIQYVFFQNEKDIIKGNYETYLVNEEIMKKISTTESPSTVVAVVKKPEYKIGDFLKFKKIALLDNIKDAGNLGTIIRACCAFGVDGIILYGDTVDEFSPKVIRATAGNMFRIPIVKANLGELNKFKKTHKFIATVVNSNNMLDDYKVDSKIIVMFGSEADGLCKELLNISDEKLTIKMAKGVESLNLALCAGVVLYKLQG